MKEFDYLKNKRSFSQFMRSLILDVDSHNLHLVQPKYERAKSQKDVMVKTTLLSKSAYAVFKSYRNQFDSDSAELRAFLHTYYLYQKKLKKEQGD